MKTFYLRELAHARSGDKGDINNIGVVAYEPHYYPLICQWLTTDRVKAHFGSLVKGGVTRYELPKVHALNFVLEGALGGGVTRSLSIDPHGKSYSALILTIPIEVPPDLAQELMQRGRQPIDET
ncbi:MAG: hypothetical protein WCH96_10385 [Betaproteobacteria bacterium]|jgi:hypothetical protein